MKNELAPHVSRRTFMRAAAATGGTGIVSAVGLAFTDARQSANQIDRRRSQMESPIEVVRRFCAAWSDNVGAPELAAFFTDDAVYHNIPLAPVTGREAIAKTIASFIRPGAPGIESIEFRVRGDVNAAAVGEGDLGLRTLLGGVAYTQRVKQLEATAGVAIGYGFGRFKLLDSSRDQFGRQGLFGLKTDATNVMVWAPRVSLWQNLTNRWAIGTTAMYVRSKPIAEVKSGDVIRRQTIDASVVRFSAGIGFKVF